MKSAFLKLNANDYVKGLIMAVGTGFLASFGQFLEQWSQPNSTLNLAMAKVSFILALKVGVGSGITYLIKNFITNSNGAVAVKESAPSAPVVAGNATSAGEDIPKSN